MKSSTAGGVTTAYVYDGNDQRVTAGNVSFIDLDGQLLFQTNGTTSVTFHCFGEERIARVDNAGAVSYYLNTSLGSPHKILNSAGSWCIRRRSLRTESGRWRWRQRR